MLGLMIIGGLVLYIMIAIKVTSYVMDKTNRTKYAVITALIFFLIPTWDLFLGYPIYWYLCKHEAGVKIYKSVDNVEGFYIGEQDATLPVEPYQGYRFIDYHDKEDGKYYRNSWLDNNTSDLCVPVGIYRYSNYAESFAKGKCIEKQELKENQVSRWHFITNYGAPYLGGLEAPIIISVLNFTHQTPFVIQDKTTSQKLGQLDYYWWQGGWVYGILSSISVGGGVGCGFEEEDQHPAITFVNTILKPNQGTLDGNN